MSSHREKLRDNLLAVLERLQYDGGLGHHHDIPEFDYYALDYLDFAELNLRRFEMAEESRDKENELIACVSNLKRALDCQIECFLHSWSLREIIKKRNLGLDKKLALMERIGLFSSRTIGRFTTLRNSIEHDFRRPDIKDLEALFDLVTAFVVILQTPMTLGFNEEIDLEIEALPEQEAGYFSLRFEAKNLRLVALFRNKNGLDDIELEASIEEYDDFAYFFRVLYLLN